MNAHENRMRIAIDKASIKGTKADYTFWRLAGEFGFTCDHPAEKKIIRPRTKDRGLSYWCKDCDNERQRKKQGREPLYV